MKLYLPNDTALRGVIIPPQMNDGLNPALGLIGELGSARSLSSRIQQVSRHLRLEFLGTVRGDNGILFALNMPPDPERLFGALGIATHRLRRAENLVETNDREMTQALWSRQVSRVGLPHTALSPSLVGQNLMGKDVVERLLGRSIIIGDKSHGEWQTHEDGAKKAANGRGPLFLRASNSTDWGLIARTAVATVANHGRIGGKELSSLLDAAGAGGKNTPSTTEFRELIEQEISLSIRQGFVKGVDEIVRLSTGFPPQTERSGIKLKLAQFSTPPAVGWLASRFIGEGLKTILEPTVGNGVLAASAASSGAHVIAFEKDEARAYRARLALGETATITVGDALDLLRQQDSVDAAVVNPPFGSIDGSKSVRLSNFGTGAESFKVTSLDAEIAVETLNKVKQGGSAVLVMPAEIYDPTTLEGQRAKLDILYRRMFNDVDTVALDAKLYKSMGANTPVLVHFLRDRSADLLPLQAAVESKKSKVDQVGTFQELISWTEARFDLDLSIPAQQIASTSDQEDRQIDVDVNDMPSGTPATNAAPTSSVEPSSDRKPKPAPNTPNAAESSEPDPSLPPKPASKEPATPTPEPVANTPLSMPQWFDSRIEIDPYTETYVPFSEVGEGSVVIQKTLQGPVYQALTEVQEEVGNIDSFVAAKLGITEDLLKSSAILSPEQVDSLALGFHKRDQGEGMIIGDKMGVGKGRQLAAHAIAALRDGSPIAFATLDATLFTDFAGRDLRDVSGKSLAELVESGEVRPFIFNPGPEGALKDPETGDVVFRTSTSEREDAKKSERIATDKNMVFFTYSQLQTKSGHWRLQAILNWLEENRGKSPILELDEVHKAAGVDSRTGVWMGMIIDKAAEVGGSVIYSSATSMKSGKNIVVYSAALPDTGMSTKELTDLMESNPLSMQEVLSAEMAADGRLIERQMPSDAERDIVRLTDLNPAKMEYAREMTDIAAGFLAELVEKAPEVKEAATKEAKQRFGGSLLNAQDKTVDVTTVSPVSQFDNYSRYLMLAVKGHFAEELLLSSIAKGEKPTAVVDSTADTLTQWIIAEQGGREIDAHPNIGHVLQRNATKLLEAKIETAMGGAEIVRMDAFAGWLENFRSRVQQHDWSGMRVNVLDKLREVAEEHGLTFRDITRRSLSVIEENGKLMVHNRETIDKASAIREFGAGETDVLALNRGAATGLSAHASPAVGPDLRRRGMIAFQFQRDIADQRQVEGRVDRFAQLSAPVYYTPSTGFAADERLSNLFNRANRNLTSSTSATRETTSTIAGVDLLNPVGDAAVAVWAKNNASFAAKMEIDPDGQDLGRKLLGRIVMLPLDDQEAVLSEIDILFSMQMEKLSREGRNPLRLSRFDWDADVETISVLVDGNPEARNMADRPVLLNRVRYSEEVHWQPTTTAQKRVSEFIEGNPHNNDPNILHSLDRLRGEGGALNFAHEVFSDARAGGAGTAQQFRNISPVLAEALLSAYGYANSQSNREEGKPRSEIATKLFFEDIRSVEKYGADTPLAKAWEEVKALELESGEVFRPSRYMSGLERAADRANFLARHGERLRPGSIVGIRMSAISDYTAGEFGRAFRKFGYEDAIVPATIISVQSPEDSIGTFSHWKVTYATAGSFGASTVSLSSMISAMDSDQEHSSPIVPFGQFYRSLNQNKKAAADVLSTVYGDTWQNVWDEIRDAARSASEKGHGLVQEPEGFRLMSAINDRVPSGNRIIERHVLEGNLFKALKFVTEKTGKATGEKAIYTDMHGIARHAVVLADENLDVALMQIERSAEHSALTTKGLRDPTKLRAFIETLHSTFSIGLSNMPEAGQQRHSEKLVTALTSLGDGIVDHLLSGKEGNNSIEVAVALAQSIGNSSEDMPVSMSFGGDVWKAAYAPSQGNGRIRSSVASYPAQIEVRTPHSWEAAPIVVDYSLSKGPLKQGLDAMHPDAVTAFLLNSNFLGVAFRKNNSLKDDPQFSKVFDDSSDNFAGIKLSRGVLTKVYDLRDLEQVNELVSVLDSAATFHKGEVSLSGPAKRIFSAIDRLNNEPQPQIKLTSQSDISHKAALAGAAP